MRVYIRDRLEHLSKTIFDVVLLTYTTLKHDMMTLRLTTLEKTKESKKKKLKITYV